MKIKIRNPVLLPLNKYLLIDKEFIPEVIQKMKQHSSDENYEEIMNEYLAENREKWEVVTLTVVDDDKSKTKK